MSINWQVEEFMCYCQSKQLRPKTMQSYEQSLRLFQRWLDEEQKITDVKLIREQVIRKYIVDLQERGKYTYYSKDETKTINYPDRRRDYRCKISNTTINNYIRNIKVFFAWLDEQQSISKNPMIKIKQLPNNRKAKDFITDEEFSRLIGRLDKSYFSEYRDYMIINLLMDTGMRIGECLSLKLNDFDFVARTIHLSAEITKGRKDRAVFFSQKVLKEIKKWIQYKDRYTESLYMFPSRNFGEQLNVSGFETNFKNYIRRAGINKTISPHSIRNNFAKRCLMSGMDIYSLSRILGHSSVTVTEKAYLDLTDCDIRQNYQRYSPIENMK